MSFGGDLAHRVRPRSVVGRPLRPRGDHSMVQRAATFGALLGRSHLQRRSLLGESSEHLAVRPPADWWPGAFDTETGEGADWEHPTRAGSASPSSAIEPTGDRKLDALRRMLAAKPGGTPTPASTPTVRRAPAAPIVPRGLPRALRRRGTAPGGLAGRMQPQNIDPDAIPDVGTARLNGSTTTPTELKFGGAPPRPAAAPSRSNDPTARLQRTLEKAGLIPPSDPGPAGRNIPPPSMHRQDARTTPDTEVDDTGTVATLQRPPLPMATAIRRTHQRTRPTSPQPNLSSAEAERRPQNLSSVGAGRRVQLGRARLRHALPLARMIRPATSDGSTASLAPPASTSFDDGQLFSMVDTDPPSAPTSRPSTARPTPVTSPSFSMVPLPEPSTATTPLPDVRRSPVAPAIRRRTTVARPTSATTTAMTPTTTPAPARDAATRVPATASRSATDAPTVDASLPSTARPAPAPSMHDVAASPPAAPTIDLPDTSVVAPPPVMVEADAPRSTDTRTTDTRSTDAPTTDTLTTTPARGAAGSRVAPDPGITSSAPTIARTSSPTTPTSVPETTSMPATPVPPTTASPPSGAPTSVAPTTSATDQVRRGSASARSRMLRSSSSAALPVIRRDFEPGVDTSIVAPPPVSIDPAARFLGELGRLPPSAAKPLPMHLQPLASVIAGDRPVRISTAAPSRRALASVGKVAATTGDVIHLQRVPTSRHDTAVLAHELTHVAHPSPAPRFFDDDRHSPEEQRAEEIADIIRRSPVLPRAAAASDTRAQRTLGTQIGGHRRSTPALAPLTSSGTSSGMSTGTSSGMSMGPSSGAVRATPSSASPGTVSAEALASTLMRTLAPPAPRISTSASTPSLQQQVTSPVSPPSQFSPESVSSADDADSPASGHLFPYDLRDTIDARNFVDWLVEQLGDRMLSQLEQRGGRFRGEF